jgi:hypothetical protein
MFVRFLGESTARQSAYGFICPLEQFIQTVNGQNNFWLQNAFFTCSWRFLMSNKLDQLEFKLEKIIGVQKHAGKFRKSMILI